MIIDNKSDKAQAIFLNPKKLDHIILQPGKNDIPKKDYEIMQKDKWFNWLIQNDLIDIKGVKSERVIDKVTEMVEKEDTNTTIDIEVKKINDKRN